MGRKRQGRRKRANWTQADPFEEYGVTPAEVERSARRALAAIPKGRKEGTLKLWKPMPSTFAELIKEGGRR